MIKNKTDKAYLELIEKILDKGKLRRDRTGTGTLSIFSHTLEIDMSDGFPLLTTKKMFTKGIIHELLWFLNGDTNIEYLVKNGVNIWTPDAYREYKNYAEAEEEPNYFLHVDDPNQNCTRVMTMEEFKERILTDDKFAEKFGELGPVYGKQWVNWGEIYKKPTGWNHGAPTHFKSIGYNQIKKALELLKHNPESRRIIVSAWNVEELNEMALPPCHWAFELYTEELTMDERISIAKQMVSLLNTFLANNMGDDEWVEQCDLLEVPKRRLHLKWHQRSVDTFLGLPFNIASYGLLLHMFAQQSNMLVGTLIGDLTNVHIYQNHIEQCKEQIGRELTSDERYEWWLNNCDPIKEVKEYVRSLEPKKRHGVFNDDNVPTRTREPLSPPKLKLNKAKDIFSYTFDDIKIVDYKCHPPIKGDISV